MLYFCGIDNPKGAGHPALDPRDPNSAGARLFDLTGLSLDEYETKYERVNAVDDPYFKKGDLVIVLGLLAWVKITKSYGISPIGKTSMLTWHEVRGRRFAMIPHTSGRNHWYNSEKNRSRVSRFLLSAFREYDQWLASLPTDSARLPLSTTSAGDTTDRTTSSQETSRGPSFQTASS